MSLFFKTVWFFLASSQCDSPAQEVAVISTEDEHFGFLSVQMWVSELFITAPCCLPLSKAVTHQVCRVSITLDPSIVYTVTAGRLLLWLTIICAWHAALNRRQKCDQAVTCGKHLSSLQNWTLPATLDQVIIRLSKEGQWSCPLLSISKVRQPFYYEPYCTWAGLGYVFRCYKNDKKLNRVVKWFAPCLV